MSINWRPRAMKSELGNKGIQSQQNGKAPPLFHAFGNLVCIILRPQMVPSSCGDIT